MDIITFLKCYLFLMPLKYVEQKWHAAEVCFSSLSEYSTRNIITYQCWRPALLLHDKWVRLMVVGESVVLVRESGRSFEEQQLGREPRLLKVHSLRHTHPTVQLVTKPPYTNTCNPEPLALIHTTAQTLALCGSHTFFPNTHTNAYTHAAVLEALVTRRDSSDGEG